jgi:hypothetical protein
LGKGGWGDFQGNLFRQKKHSFRIAGVQLEAGVTFSLNCATLVAPSSTAALTGTSKWLQLHEHGRLFQPHDENAFFSR